MPSDFGLCFANGHAQAIFCSATNPGHPEHEVISHVSDEAIDEFIPDAFDVAEIEAAEDFVEQLAYLDFQEEIEEAARTSFAGYGLRFAARRREGLVRVRPARAVGHRPRSGTVSSATEFESDLVAYHHRRHQASTPIRLERTRGCNVAKIVKSKSRRVNPIHQPRKHY